MNIREKSEITVQYSNDLIDCKGGCCSHSSECALGYNVAQPFEGCPHSGDRTKNFQDIWSFSKKLQDLVT